MTLRIFINLLPLLAVYTNAFVFISPSGVRVRSSSRRSSSNTVGSEIEASDAVAVRVMNGDGLYTEERYVSTLRFLVPKEEEIAFENQWTTIASELNMKNVQDKTEEGGGLKYFHMGKRGMDFMGPPLPDDEFNYQSFAVWESKDAYEKNLGLFEKIVSDRSGSPANYEGIFALSVPSAISGVPTGLTVSATTPADTSLKQKRLPREAFVASNRFGIKPGFEKDFEDMWAARDTSLADLPGFVNFQLLRREGSVDDGNTYLSYTTWDSGKAFNNWRDSDNFKRSHSKSGGEQKESPYAKMPKVVTFQNFLVSSAEDGM
mmetsp:Transcript_48548/g.58580  ORF Transcript_48548/g.58580 Transcript_48548/m.58580 type:complete len:318 (-) Transcript_48548:281-1234(-)|eukprot:CAMPEP_0194388674 /NCGR_PEP_ID=MMETSP0174-20130528/99841_1 /TAXON_ID=216777 /ORGANISM="Proboscia alata, Strain PI-D3" /LENGTH=317 /DNA_ID=CAMNT_0039180191 /DNA_START=101 /DNA_END=1054 /DNA_ORIENTATION=-